jgi:dihydrolipoamide dehydrogenase
VSKSSEPGAGSTVLRIPDLGGAAGVVVLEVLVKAGERIEKETPLLTLESDKATMDVPAEAAGVIEQVLLAPGDKVAAGTAIARLRDPAAGEVPPDADETLTRAALRSPEPYGGEPYLDTVPIKPMAPPAGGGAASAAVAAVSPGEPAPGTAGAPRSGRHPYDFDLVVLGAGPGGYTAAFRAADLGLGVALIERGPTLGGVCLNVGCIPSKALLHAARVIEDARAMAEHGIRFGEPAIDAARLREWKDSVVARLTNGLDALARQRKVTVIRGEAKFASAHEFEVVADGSARRVSFAQCVIAVGSEPVRLPGMPDDPRVIDSTGALELDLPESLLVIGGGIIGLEMATVYDALGVRVSVAELTPGLMPGCDRDLVRPLEKRIARRYERILTGTRVAGAEATSDGLRVSFEGERAPGPQHYGKVLVAVGRVPNGRRINAEAAGLAVGERGFIAVDRQMRTSVPHIYAIGDVVGQPMLAHKATHEGKVAAEAAAGLKSFFDARVIPSVAYTDPEIAWVGLTETDAKAQGVACEKAVFPWSASGRSLALGRDEGLTKLLFDPESHRVLGAGIVGSSAGDLIAEAALAIEMGADAADLALTIHPHPTLSETVAMAAEAFEGTLTDLYLPKRKGTAQRG